MFIYSSNFQDKVYEVTLAIVLLYSECKSLHCFDIVSFVCVYYFIVINLIVNISSLLHMVVLFAQFGCL